MESLLFSKLIEKKKLYIVRYNKKLQNEIKINLIDYKFFTGRYIIYETKERKKGKEYNGYEDMLLYEGEYLNELRNGKGKEYYYDERVKFEGEFLNGKRNGLGKEYDREGNMMFEGEYINGERNGKGKVFYEGKFDFEGEFLNGKHCFGKRDVLLNNEIYETNDEIGLRKDFKVMNKYYQIRKLVYQGEYVNGIRHGKGKQFKDLKMIFEGEYKNGKKWNGKGYDGNHNLLYELKDGKGLVKEEIKYDTIFEGEYLNGERNGKGKEYISYINKIIFEGEYLNGKRHGKGKEYDDDKIIFEGDYLYGHRRKGKQYVIGRLDFEGDYLYDKKWNGKGYDENGKIIYELNDGNGTIKEYNNMGIIYFEGEQINGKRNGKGKNYWNGKLTFEGEYLNGKRNGIGKEYDLIGNVMFEGEYLNDKRWNGKGKEYNSDNNTLEFEGEYKNGEKIYEE